ncbi:MAG: peptide ABC transporter substrate-binding protein [Vulcanimicrobiaceae bacterium]
MLSKRVLRPRRPVAALLAGALAALVAAGCTKVGTSTPGESARHPSTIPHVLRFASAEDLVGLNPLVNSQATLGELSSMTMAWLVKTDAQGYPTVPELCTEVPTQQNGGISPDGKTITWHLRRGVRWSDGAPFTADDVVFSTKLILDPHTNIISRDGWDLITKIGEPDKYTVVYHLSKPYAPYAVTFFSTGGANPAVMPKHLLEGKDINTAAYNALPVGIGPFKYESWKRGDSVTLVPNPLYFRGTPKLKRVVYELVQDRNTVLEELRSHELDLWTPVSPHYFPQVKTIPGIATLTTPSYFFDHLDFNVSHPVLADQVVRRALRMALDRPVIIKKIQFGIYDLNESVVPLVSHFHVNIPQVPFDIAQANAMLDRDGWRRGPDGIRQKNGVRLVLDFATASGTADTDQEIELYRSWWKQLGVSLVVKHYLSSLFFAPAEAGGIIFGGKFDVVAFAWGGDPVQGLANLYSCGRFPPDGQNDLRYCNRAVSAAIDHAQVHYDAASRSADLALVQRQIFADAPTIVLDNRRELYGYNSDLRNFHPNPVAPFDDMMNVDI